MRRFVFLFSMIGLSACSPQKEEARNVADDDGQPAYHAEQNGDELSLSLKTDEGRVHVRSGKSVKLDLPDGYSLYPGAEVLSNTVLDRAKEKAFIVTMRSHDGAEAMGDFYRRQAEAEGVRIESAMRSNRSVTLSGRKGKGEYFTFSANTGESETVAQLSLSVAKRG